MKKRGWVAWVKQLRWWLQTVGVNYDRLPGASRRELFSLYERDFEPQEAATYALEQALI